MSHHLYPNSYHDLEISLFEPWLDWMPVEKSKLRIIGFYVATPLIYALLFITEFVTK